MDHTIVISDDKTVDRTDRVEILEAGGATVETPDEKTEDALAEAVRGADGLIVDAATSVTPRVLEAGDTLEVVGRSGVGVDNIDVAAAAARDVTVVNVPAYGVDEVSTHALALLLACVRAVPRYDRAVKDGEWDWRTGRPIGRIAGGTLGVVGFGRIGRRFTEKAGALGLDVIAADPYVDAAAMRERGVEKVAFDELLDRAGYVSVHVPLYDETRDLFSTAAFERLPDDAVFVNTSRGPVVDQSALLAALETGEVAAAGLDVLASEPPAPDDPLLGREDVVVTPHAAWYSAESRADLSEGVARAVAAVLRGETPDAVVDPETPWV